MELFKFLQENTDINLGSWHLSFNAYLTDRNNFTKKEYYTWWMDEEDIDERVENIDFTKNIYDLVWYDMTQVGSYSILGNSLKDIEEEVKQCGRRNSLCKYIKFEEPPTKLFELLETLNKPYDLNYNEHHVDVRHDDNGDVDINDIVWSYCRCHSNKKEVENITNQIKKLNSLKTIYTLKIENNYLFGNTLKELEDKVRDIYEVEKQ